MGMDKEDLPLAIERHATSKIQVLDDLSQLVTLGFRGEALASIASVATVSIASRPAQAQVGHILRVDRQRPQPLVAKPMPVGTTIMVTDIFTALPARRKFLKKPQVELKQIQDSILQTALAQPEIGFDLFHGERLLLHAPAHQTIEDRVTSLFGWEFASQLLPLYQQNQFVTLKGYLGKPQLAHRYNAKQFFSINQRPISPATLHKVIKQLYGSLLEPRSEPAFIIALTLPPTVIDPNVHPRKETVGLIEEKVVFEVLKDAMQKALTTVDVGYTYQAQSLADTSQMPHHSQSDHSPELGHLPGPTRDTHMLGSLAHHLKKMVASWSVKDLEPDTILQLDKTYLIYVTPTTAVIVDQHAAHERILFEQFKATFLDSRTVEQQPLPEPILIDLPIEMTRQITSSDITTHPGLHQLSSIGFAFEPFGPHSISMTHVPAWFSGQDTPTIVRTVLETHDAVTTDLVDIVEPLERTLAYLACRSAVKAGDTLTTNERYKLIEQLTTTPSNATCPHGRPTHINFPLAELHHLFKRN